MTTQLAVVPWKQPPHEARQRKQNKSMTRSATDKLIIALDVDTKEKALTLIEALSDVAGMFKIGSQLFTAAGPDIVREVIAKGARVFLDLKFHDIPATVAVAGVEATRLGVSIFSIHASGGREMMRAASDIKV